VNSNARFISDVPKEKIPQIIEDLQYEFGKDRVRITSHSQPNGLFRLEYVIDEPSSSTSGSANQRSNWK